MDLIIDSRKFSGAKARQLVGWTPIRVTEEDGKVRVLWLDLRGVPIQDPFFSDTIVQGLGKGLMGRSRLRVAETGLGVLAGVRKLSSSLKPAGFVFHMTRCGSTLAANQLEAITGSLVLREPLQIDNLILIDHLSESEKIRRLRDLVATLGQTRPGKKRLFIKFGVLSVLKMSLVLKAFPDVPWVFLYRDPVEVMTSNFNDAMLNWVWNEQMNGLTTEQLAHSSWAEVSARSLARMCRAAVQSAGPKSLMINYSRYDGATLFRHFGIEPTAAELRVLRKVERRYSKAPVGSRRTFKPDSRKKRKTSLPVVRRMARVWLAKVYKDLEQLASGLHG